MYKFNLGSTLKRMTLNRGRSFATKLKSDQEYAPNNKDDFTRKATTPYNMESATSTKDNKSTNQTPAFNYIKSTETSKSNESPELTHREPNQFQSQHPHDQSRPDARGEAVRTISHDHHISSSSHHINSHHNPSYESSGLTGFGGFRGTDDSAQLRKDYYTNEEVWRNSVKPKEPNSQEKPGDKYTQGDSKWYDENLADSGRSYIMSKENTENDPSLMDRDKEGRRNK